MRKFKTKVCAITAIFAVSLFLDCCSLAYAERRVALVIGNGAYKHYPVLKNPKNDAADVSNALTKLGFQVTSGIDLTRPQMVQKIKSFNEQLEKDDTVVFFYAGHGLQMNGQNLVIPIDSNVTTDKEVFSQTLAIQKILKNITDEASRLIVFLDACRNNPFRESFQGTTLLAVQPDGLAREALDGKNVFFAFATEPGKVASDGGNERNSPFTSAILSNIKTKKLDISNMMINVRREVFDKTKQLQLPWSNSSLLDTFYFQNVQEINIPAKKGQEVELDPATLLATANEYFIEQNYVKSAELYKKAADQGVRKAMTEYGKLLLTGIGIQENQKKATIWFEKAAKAGDPEAQFLMGRIIEKGTKNSKKNHASALHWYKLSARNGFQNAMNNLAIKYSLGEGVKVDFRQAVHWLNLASEKGHPNALFNLASLYDDGKGVKKSPKIAAQLMVRSILRKNRLAKLEMTQNHSAWSRSFKKEFQKLLKELDLYSGPIDSTFGRGTKKAIGRMDEISKGNG